MSNMLRTATLIASIACVIVFTMMGAKGFQLGAGEPVLTGPDVTAAAAAE